MNIKNLQLVLFSLILFSCNTSSNNSAPKDSVAYASAKIPETRSTVIPDALKIYEETVKSFETTDDFKVSLFETKQTFKYLIKISYKNLTAEDTLHVPNFGIEPSADIIEGTDTRPSCIVGFYDAEKKFRESKLVYFEDNMIKVHVLKHYGVFSK